MPLFEMWRNLQLKIVHAMQEDITVRPILMLVTKLLGIQSRDNRLKIIDSLPC
jgi:hypothetical protein